MMHRFHKLITVLLIPVLLSVSVCSVSSTALCEAKLHAYTLSRVSVSGRNGRQLGTLEKGIAFSYQKQSGKSIEFNYYGKKGFIRTDRLILNDKIENYVRNHASDFECQIKVLKGTTVYRRMSTGSSKYCNVSKGTTFKSYGEYRGWYKVQMDGTFYYIPSAGTKKTCYVDVALFPKISGSSEGERIVSYAKRFVGNPYVWGGTSLTMGCDCSGFVQSVYKQFGYRLPRCSKDQAVTGKEVSFKNLKPGDLLFYYRGSRIGHVTMYIGNGKCVQARGRRYGIVITDYDYNKPAWARRII